MKMKTHEWETAYKDDGKSVMIRFCVLSVGVCVETGPYLPETPAEYERFTKVREAAYVAAFWEGKVR